MALIAASKVSNTRGLSCTAIILVLNGGFNIRAAADTKHSFFVYIQLVVVCQVILNAAIPFVWILCMYLLHNLRNLLVFQLSATLLTAKPAVTKFPVIMPKKATTTVVLKAPKTESSNRTVYLPRAVVEELLAMQEMDSGFFNKVEDVADTSPLDDASIEKLKALIKQHPELLNELLNTN